MAILGIDYGAPAPNSAKKFEVILVLSARIRLRLTSI